MVVEWSCSGQILNEIIFSLWQVKVRYIYSFTRNFYENIQSAHWQGIVKETMDTNWRQCENLTGG